MQLVLQYQAVAILAAVSAFATLFYLSLWSDLNSVDMDESSSTPRPYTHSSPSSLTSPSLSNPNMTKEQSTEQYQPLDERLFSKNAHITDLNSRAFVAFCNSINNTNIIINQQRQPTVNSNDISSDFSSYREWMEYIHNTKDSEANSKHPRFLERPPHNRVIEFAAIKEPCNRRIHTSAHCLDYLAKREHEYLISASPPITIDSNKMDFHIFWRGPITDKLSLSSHAFLFTQPLNRAHLHLWIDSADLPGGVPEDYIKNPYSAPLVTEPLNQYITIHSWNQTAELAYSYPNQQSEQEIGKDGPAKPVALSDEARFLILNRNGGIYLDADVLLLKDMSPFYDAGLEFAYEWSHTGMYNTAILRLLPGSSVARRILDGAKRRKAEILRLKQLERELQRQRMEEQQLEAEMEEMEEEERREKELENIRDEEKEASVAKKSTLDFVHQVRTHVKNKALKPLPKSSSHRRLRRRQLRVLHGMRPEEIYHPARLREYLRPQDKAIEGNGLIMVPPAVFDPLWLRVDHAEPTKSTDPEKMLEDLPGFTDVFHEAPNTVCPRQEGEEVEFSAGPEVFFTGAYAYHWHNSWQASIEPKSWMGFMLKAYKDSVERRRPNLYGEWFPKNL